MERDQMSLGRSREERGLRLLSVSSCSSMDYPPVLPCPPGLAFRGSLLPPDSVICGSFV